MARHMHPAVPSHYQCCACMWGFCLVLAVAAIGALVALGVTVVKQRVEVKDYIEANCSVLQHRLNVGELRECACGKTCQSTYPCHQALVNYVDVNGEEQKRILLHIDESELENTCSFIPDGCQSSSAENAESINSFLEKYSVNSTFTCFYNPADQSQVLAIKNTMILHYLLWPALAVLLFSGLTVATTKTCRVATKMDRALKEARSQNKSEEEINAIVASYTNQGSSRAQVAPAMHKGQYHY